MSCEKMSLVLKNEVSSCEKLSLIGFLNEIKDVNVGPHPRKFCFVLGAGASRTSGIKSGQELVNIWDNELDERNSEDYYKWKIELGITDENKYSFYSQYYEKRYARQPSDGYNYLEKLMEKARPSIGYVMLSYLLTQTSNNVVITTNFDHLIEVAVNYYAHTMPLVIGHESLAHYVTSQITRPTIIKIHRDLLFDPANRSDEVEELHENWREALNNIFQNYNPVFIGYAGNDNSLMNYLITNADKFSNNIFCPAYWMLYNKDKIEGKVKAFLDNSHSYYIPHNGFDETIYRITGALGIKAPTREDIVDEAEQRYQNIENSINLFTQKILYNENLDSISESDDVKKYVSTPNKLVSENENKENELMMYIKATSLYLNKQYNDALDIESELIKRCPKVGKYYDQIGRTLYALKRYKEAIKNYHKAIELEPKMAFYYIHLGDVFVEMKQYDEAIAEYRKAIVIEPKNAFYRSKLGNASVEMERYDEAIVEYHKAIELNPEEALYHSKLGDVLAEMERYDEAIEECHKAIELEPEDAFYHSNLGDVLAEMERYDEAATEYRKATELDPKITVYKSKLDKLLLNIK